MKAGVSEDDLGLILRIVLARALNTFCRAVLSSTVLWELYRRTGDNLVVAAVGAVLVIPVFLFFVPAGALVDRSDRRTLLTAIAALTGLLGIGLALASRFAVPVPVYLALLFLMGCCTSVQAPASGSLLPMLLPRESLVRGNRITSSVLALAAIAGPSLSGLALTAIAPHWIYAAVALSAAAAALTYGSLPPQRAIVADASDASDARRDWRVGLRFIFASPLLLPALTLDMFAVLFAGVTALLPAVASDVLHVDSFGYGLLVVSQSVGAMVMGAIGGRLPPWQRPGRVLLIVVALYGATIMAFGMSRSLSLSIGLLVLCGALDNVSVVIRLTLEQLVAPDSIRGRVNAVHFVFIGASNELGAAESGLAASLIGTVPAIVAGGAVAMLVAGLVAVRWRELAAMPPLHQLSVESDTRG